MNALLTAQALLREAWQAYPRLALAHAAAWLDPVHFGEDTSAPAYDGLEEDDAVDTALFICRDLFPAVYSGAVQRLWQGVDESTLENYLCDGINAHLVMKLESLEGIQYGLPIEVLGVNYREEEFFERYPHLADLLADFGITPNSPPNDEAVQQAVRQVFESLERQPGTTYSDVRWLLAWLFSGSGNTCLDMSPEDFWDAGIEALDWSSENLAFMNDMATEAQMLLEAARRGLDALQTDAALRQALRHNVRRLMTPERPGRKEYAHDCLRWPDRP